MKIVIKDICWATNVATKEVSKTNVEQIIGDVKAYLLSKNIVATLEVEE